MIKFLVIGDLHGIKPKIHLKKFDAIIAPGDIYGDDIRPYMKKYLIEVTKKGRGNVDFKDFCSDSKAKKLENKSLKKGIHVLKYLNSFNLPVFLVPGNWDPIKTKDWKENNKLFKNIIDCDLKLKKFKGINIVEN